MIDLDTLDPEFRDKLVNVMEDAKAGGFRIVPYIGTVDVAAQAKIWRQSRSDTEIDDALTYFKSNECKFLYKVLLEANVQSGPKITEYLPGLSWHNWRRAVKYDIYDYGTGLLDNSLQFIEVIKKSIKKNKLHLGSEFGRSHFEIQFSSDADPLKSYDIKHINSHMEEMWGEQVNGNI